MGICECHKDPTNNAKPIPELIKEKLYNSIAKIKTDKLRIRDRDF